MTLWVLLLLVLLLLVWPCSATTTNSSTSSDLTLLRVSSRETVTFTSSAIPPLCGVCVLFNTTRSSRSHVLRTSYGRMYSGSCPAYFPGVHRITLSITSAQDQDAFVYSCCANTTMPFPAQQACDDANAGSLLNGGAWASLAVICLVVVFVVLARNFIVVLAQCAYLGVWLPLVAALHRCWERCRKRCCAQCGGCLCKTTGWLCSECRPPPPFASVSEFLDFYEARMEEKTPPPAAGTDECGICFERGKAWRLACGHELCLVCVVKTLRMNPVCPFDRLAVSRVPVPCTSSSSSTTTAA